MLSNEEGAKTQLWCATAPELASETGRYHDKRREAPCNPLADDPALAKELWTRTERAIAGTSRRPDGDRTNAARSRMTGAIPNRGSDSATRIPTWSSPA